MKDVAIRHATIADTEVLVASRVAMQRELGELGDDNEPHVIEAVRAYLQETLPTDELVALLAEAGGEVVGTGLIVLFNKPPSSGNLAGVEGYVLNMYTPPEWRGRGIARRIVEELLEAARVAGAPIVWLRATPAGRRVYEKVGFAEYPRYLQVKLDGEPT